MINNDISCIAHSAQSDNKSYIASYTVAHINRQVQSRVNLMI